MIKEMPLTFLDVEKYGTYDLFYVCTSEALTNEREQFQKKAVPLIFMQF